MKRPCAKPRVVEKGKVQKALSRKALLEKRIVTEKPISKKRLVEPRIKKNQSCGNETNNQELISMAQFLANFIITLNFSYFLYT